MTQKRFTYRKCKPVLALTELNKMERLNFATKMLELFDGDGEKDPEKKIENNIVFSDEKLFHTSAGVPSVWVPHGEPTPTVARHRRTAGAMAWLGFSARWCTQMVFVTGKINCKVYASILERLELCIAAGGDRIPY